MNEVFSRAKKISVFRSRKTAPPAPLPRAHTDASRALIKKYQIFSSFFHFPLPFLKKLCYNSQAVQKTANMGEGLVAQMGARLTSLHTPISFHSVLTRNFGASTASRCRRLVDKINPARTPHFVVLLTPLTIADFYRVSNLFYQ
ncbi:MAG: hypothetical protein IJS45_00960 [Clostridia bacterium]|nr:hypothetical protein [Clostridia bacterium]